MRHLVLPLANMRIPPAHCVVAPRHLVDALADTPLRSPSRTCTRGRNIEQRDVSGAKPASRLGDGTPAPMSMRTRMQRQARRVPVRSRESHESGASRRLRAACTMPIVLPRPRPRAPSLTRPCTMRASSPTRHRRSTQAPIPSPASARTLSASLLASPRLGRRRRSWMVNTSIRGTSQPKKMESGLTWAVSI